MYVQFYLIQVFLFIFYILGDQGDRDLRAQAYIGLGNAYAANKEDEEVIKWYTKAAKIKPNDQKIQDSIRRCQSYSYQFGK